MAGLIFNGREELLDDGTDVLLAVFKGSVFKTQPGRVIQGALVKARGLPGFLQLLGFQ
ncbi:hypothetical protein D3C85_1803680 [compost metagenome]